MNLIDKKNKIEEYLIETLDDLWVLSQYINENDIIYSTTLRKIKIGNEESYKIAKKIIYTELKVKQVKFENDILKVTGEILNETEYTSKGVNHSLKFNLSDKIKINKYELLNFEKKLIKNACKNKKSHNLIILLDKDDLKAIEFSDINYKVLLNETGLGSKKYNLDDINEEEEKLKLIENLLNRNYNNIILVGPGLYKDKLQKYIKDNLGIKTLTFAYQDIRIEAVTDIIRKISENNILEDSQIAYENRYVNHLLFNINKGEKYVYSFKKVEESINMGRVEVLLITTNFIAEKKEKGDFLYTNNLIKLSEQLNAEFVIVNSKNKSGKILDGLSGIAAILRY